MLKKQPADDLFEKSSMSFGEHLEELRRSLTKAFIWLGVGTVIGLIFAEDIVKFVESPLKLAIYDFHVAQAKSLFEEANGSEPSPQLAEWMTANGMMPERVFVDPAALLELPESSPTDTSIAAQRLRDEERDAANTPAVAEPVPAEKAADNKKDTEPDSPGSSVSEAAESEVSDVDLGDANEGTTKRDAEDTIAEIVTSSEFNPWKDIDLEKLQRLRPFLLWQPIPNKLVSLTAVEGFMIWLKAGLVAGVIIGSPGIFWHIWQFFAAGLYPHERRYVYWYLPISLTLFLAGVSLAFFVIFRLVLGFLMTYTSGLDVEFTPRLNDYMSFALFLPLGFGIAFQLPIVMLGLHRFGVVSVDLYISQWRMAILLIAFLSMLLTPAEIYSMLGLFIPLTGLYFLGIVLCKYMPTGAGIGSAGLDPE